MCHPPRKLLHTKAFRINALTITYIHSKVDCLYMYLVYIWDYSLYDRTYRSLCLRLYVTQSYLYEFVFEIIRYTIVRTGGCVWDYSLYNRSYMRLCLRLFVIQSYVQEFVFEIIRYTIVRTRVCVCKSWLRLTTWHLF